MSFFICPKCRSDLEKRDNSFYCQNGHCFDVAKSGYVNLLMNNRSSEKPRGDDKQMVQARKRFLDGGYYDKLIEKLCLICNNLSNEDSIILDAGCGEGKYTQSIFYATRQNNVKVYGVDISKTAVDAAKKRCKDIEYAVAGIDNMPVKDESVDVLLNIFAPDSESEFSRVLKKNGYFIKVIPLEDHLIELKNVLYDNVVKTEVKKTKFDSFDTVGFEEIKYGFSLENNESIHDLFTMTPYYYKTSQKDRQKLENTDRLQISACFGIIIYKKK